MKICTTETEFLEYVIPFAQKVSKRYGILSSVLVAQAALETGYAIEDYWDNAGARELVKYNCLIGQKVDLLNASWDDKSVWYPRKSFNKLTPEEYGGNKVTIKDDFRIYDCVERSFADYAIFLKCASYSVGGTPKYGDTVLSIKDPEKQIKRISELGYATDSNYSRSVTRIINKHNLTKYDDLTGIEPTIYTPGYKGGGKVLNTKKLVAPKFIDNRATSKTQVPKWVNKSDKKWIVVHYLGVVGQNFELWNNGYGATFTIGWNGDVYYTADYTAVTWQCGGKIQGESKDKSGVAPHRYYGQCTNYNSVSIENCVKRTDNKYEGDDNDDKWYFTEETQESLVWAVSKMMDDLNIPFERVIRHFDVTGKTCPNPYVRNNGMNGNWTWEQFKANLAQYRKDGTITLYNGASPVAPVTPDTEKYHYKVRKVGTDEKTQIEADEILDNAKKTANKNRGYKVFDSNKNFECVYDPFRWKFLDALQSVVDLGRKENWTYGNSQSIPPCADKLCSCDRSIARALYNIGFTDQVTGGETCGTLGTYLPAHGWKKVTDKSKIEPGAVVEVRYTNHNYVDHVFVVVSYDPKTGLCTKYDTGSTQQIRSQQPFKDVPLLSWGANRIFVAAYNPPETATSPSEPDQKEDTSGIVFPTTFNGINYKLVYNYTFYKKKYADLQQAYGNDKNAYFTHFCVFGMKEGRQAKSTFDVQKYKNRYEDLRKAFGNNLPEYYKHYIQYGKREGRKAT